jgi:hypothetical protein
MFANGAHNLALRDRNGWITTFDISAIANRDFAYPSIGGTFALGTGTATRIPIWTNANTLGDSPIAYNSTTKRTTWDSPGILELPMGTDAQRPTATTSDFWYNTTSNGLEWYNGTRWAKGLESTANRFTTGSLIFADANGQATQNNANFFYNNNLFILRLGPVAAGDRAEIGTNDGSGLPYLRLANIGVIDAYLRVSDAGRFAMSTGLDVTGVISTTSNFKAVGLASFGVGVNGNGALGGELILRPLMGQPGFINFIENGMTVWANMGVDNGNGDFKYETLPSTDIAWETGTTRFVIKQNGRVGIGASTTVNYNLEQVGQTDAFGIARGTVAQRPTIVANTTPIRYSVDSIALEYGESVGIWRQIATRAYARSLVSGLSPDTWLGTRLPAGNVTIDSKGNQFNLDSLAGRFKIANNKSFYFQKSEPGFVARFEPYQYLEYTANGDPRIEMRSFSGDNLDSPGDITQSNSSPRLGSINFRGYKNGAWRRGASISSFPDSVGASSVYGSLRFNVGANISGFAAGDSYMSITSKGIVIGNGILNTDSDAIFQMDGTNSSTGYLNPASRIYTKVKRSVFAVQDATTYSFVHNPFQDTTYFRGNVKFGSYGTGAKEAADLSKTQSNYVAGFATDGTVLDIPINTELYNTITSTSSPQTLSSTIADNLINQGGTQATFTFKLPATPVDGQISKATFANAVTALTIDGNGTIVTGTLPTTAAAGQQIIFKNYSGLGWVRQL